MPCREDGFHRYDVAFVVCVLGSGLFPLPVFAEATNCFYPTVATQETRSLFAALLSPNSLLSVSSTCVKPQDPVWTRCRVVRSHEPALSPVSSRPCDESWGGGAALLLERDGSGP